tara:strand:- start:777 stop:1220 length:444 start_codon:yes stop_codon:yes gene_type:complete
MTDAQSPSRLGLWLMTIGTAIYTFIPPVVDILTPTHIFNPDWVGHARFHTMWAIISASAVGLLALGLLWRGPKAGQIGVHISGAISSCVLGAFLLAAATIPLYGGALTDPNGVPPIAEGVDANLVSFAAALLMVLTGWRLTVRETAA